MPRPDPTRVTIVAHPPERGRTRALAPAQAGASCCCCCCCLHSLGAIIGAGIAPAFGRRRTIRTQEEEDYADFGVDRPVRGHGPSAVGLFWLSTLVLGSLVIIGGGILSAAQTVSGEFVSGALGGLFAIVMLAPALFLIAAAVAALILGLSGRPDKLLELRQLGRITLGMVLGTVIGIVPMAAVLLVLMYK
jgi:hypothetical protein